MTLRIPFVESQISISIFDYKAAVIAICHKYCEESQHAHSPCSETDGTTLQFLPSAMSSSTAVVTKTQAVHIRNAVGVACSGL